MALSPISIDVFAAIGDPTRRGLLDRLAHEGEKTVTELVEPLAISQPAVSKHLRCLRQAGLVRSETRGKQRVYTIEVGALREVHDWVSTFEKYWDEKLDALENYLEKNKRKSGSSKPRKRKP